MKVVKVINNNIVNSMDNNKREIIVMGCGLGFAKKPGDIIEADKVEKIFRMDSHSEIKQLEDILADVPLNVIQVINEIIENATKQIGQLQKSIYITLIDHINFAIERKRQNMVFENMLFYDVKRLYKAEYQIGKEALQQINEKLGVDLPKEEATAIALHFLNARFEKRMPETLHITKIAQNIIRIVQSFFNMEIMEDMVGTDYFFMYVKFFVERIINDGMLYFEEEEVSNVIKEKFVKSSECAERIAAYIRKEYKKEVTQAEMIDLILNLERIVIQNGGKGGKTWGNMMD